MSRALVQDLRRSPDVAGVMLLAMASVHGGHVLLEHADRPRRCGAARRGGRLDRRRLLAFHAPGVHQRHAAAAVDDLAAAPAAQFDPAQPPPGVHAGATRPAAPAKRKVARRVLDAIPVGTALARRASHNPPPGRSGEAQPLVPDMEDSTSLAQITVLCDSLGGGLAVNPLAVAAPGGSDVAAVGGLDVLQCAAVVGQCVSDGTLPGGLGNLDGPAVCDERRVQVLLGCAHGDHFFRGSDGGTGTGPGRGRAGRGWRAAPDAGVITGDQVNDVSCRHGVRRFGLGAEEPSGMLPRPSPGAAAGVGSGPPGAG